MLLYYVGNQGHLTGALDFVAKFALVLCAGSGKASGFYFAYIGSELAHDVQIFVIYLDFFVGAELTVFLTGEFLFSVGHIHCLLS